MICYLFSSSSMAINAHYCGGKLNAIKIAWGTSKQTCGCASKAMNKGCCTNQQVIAQLKDSHKTPASHVLIKAPCSTCYAAVPYFCTQLTQWPISCSTYHHADAPPKQRSSELFILHASFLI